MNKKISILLLVVLLVAALLAGCGSNNTGSGNKTGDETGKNQTGNTESGGDTASQGPIKIGANLELSGGVASYGQSILEGVDLAVEQINNGGGINGRMLEVVKADNKSDAPEAVSNATKLITQDKVVAIIGSATSGNTMAQIDIANENKVPIISPSGTNTGITVNDKGELNEYAFRTCFIDPFQGDVAARFAVNELKVSKAAVYVDSSSDYSKGLADSFKKVFTENGGEIVAEEAFVKGDTDFRSTLTRIKTANPDFLYIPAYYEEVGLIIKQARELGIEAALMGGDGWDSPTLVELAGTEALNNAYVTNAYSPEDSDPAVVKFVEDFKAKYNGKSPDAFAALGYDTVYFLADAMKRASEITGEKIKEALEATDGLQLVTGKMKLDEQHNPIKGAAILKYENGVAKFLTKVNP